MTGICYFFFVKGKGPSLGVDQALFAFVFGPLFPPPFLLMAGRDGARVRRDRMQGIKQIYRFCRFVRFALLCTVFERAGF
jgi:hypothetical protein